MKRFPTLHPLAHWVTRRAFSSIAAALVLLSAETSATSDYDYGKDEYVTIGKGISPSHKLAITAHAGEESGFHLYLFDAGTGKKIGALEEITDTLDTGAGAFAAKWSEDSSTVTIVYRVDRHAPLKSITYRIVDGKRAAPATKKPVDVVPESNKLIDFWGEVCSAPKPSEKTFGTPKKDKTE